MDDQDIRIKAIKSLDFLRDHPGVNNDLLGDSLFDGLWFYMAKCCKRGKAESCKKSMQIYRGEKNWHKFKDRFDKEKESDEDTDFQHISVTYEEYYGEPWVFDHVEYWYETTFSVFQGDPFDDRQYMEYKNWGRYAGPEGGANTFEDMLIQCERKVRRAFGSFNHLDKRLYLPEELNNNKSNRMFSLKKITSGKNKNGSELIREDEYVDVNDGLLNLRWLKWFVETDYCKKHWEYNMPEFKNILKKLDNVPEKRMKILNRYKG